MQIKSRSLKVAIPPFEKLSPGDRVKLQKFSDDIHHWLMDKGTIIAGGAIKEILQNIKARQTYLGGVFSAKLSF